MIKVCKFGGSSVANADQFKKIKAIVDEQGERKIIVASALGKNDAKDHKVTDLLYLCVAHKKYGMSYSDLLLEIKKKHETIIDKLGLCFDLESEMKKIEQLLEKSDNTDEVISRGEYLSSKLLALFLDAEFVDAKDVVSFNYDGSLNIELTKSKFLPYLRSEKKIVVPGFYGCLPNGIIKTMTRGGSDITGALLANVVDADVYENWTDVSGVYVADPKIIENPKMVSTITYSELREMSFMGANVLHEESVLPVKEKNIPINIRNTNRPSDAGTMIVSQSDGCDQIITGITGKKGFEVISITKQGSTSDPGFLSGIFATFENFKIPVVLITTSIDSCSLIVERACAKDRIYELVNELKTRLSCDEIEIYGELALVCIVGRNMRQRKGMAGNVFSMLGENGINIRTISQGSDEISIIVGIDESDFKRAVESLYEGFIK